MPHQFVINLRFLWCQVAKIMHSFPRCIFILHFDLEKTRSTCCNLVAKG